MFTTPAVVDLGSWLREDRVRGWRDLQDVRPAFKEVLGKGSKEFLFDEPEGTRDPAGNLSFSWGWTAKEVPRETLIQGEFVLSLRSMGTLFIVDVEGEAWGTRQGYSGHTARVRKRLQGHNKEDLLKSCAAWFSGKVLPYQATQVLNQLEDPSADDYRY